MCYQPDKFRNVMKAEAHHLLDAIGGNYGQCSYLRLIDEFGTIHCYFLLGKPRVSSIKYVSIPSMELTAATLSIKIYLSKLIKRELDIGDHEET